MTWAPQYAPTIKAATLHHTASSNNYTAADVPAILRGIYYAHAVSNGWGDIGYNVARRQVRPALGGPGRRPGPAPPSARTPAATTPGTFGVSMLGNYDTVNTTQPMIDSVAAIIAWKFSLYGVDPRGTTTLVSGGGGTARSAGQSVTLPTIFGHRDVGSDRLSRPVRLRPAAGDPDQGDRGAVRSAAHHLRPVRHRRRRCARCWAPRSAREQMHGRRRPGSSTQAARLLDGATGAHVVGRADLGRYMAAGGPAVAGRADHRRAAHARRRRPVQPLQQRAPSTGPPATGAQLVRRRRSGALWGRRTGRTARWATRRPARSPGTAGASSTFPGGTVFWTPAGAEPWRCTATIGRRWTALGGLDWAVPTSSERAVGTAVARRRLQHVRRQPGDLLVRRARARTSCRGRSATAGPPSAARPARSGFPTADEQAGPDGVRYSLFQDGGVYWTAAGRHAGRAGRHPRAAGPRLGGVAGSGFGVPGDRRAGARRTASAGSPQFAGTRVDLLDPRDRRARGRRARSVTAGRHWAGSGPRWATRRRTSCPPPTAAAGTAPSRTAPSTGRRRGAPWRSTARSTSGWPPSAG